MGAVKMQFILDNDVYKVARITGPEHNFLGIRLADTNQGIDVVELPLKVGERRQIDTNMVLEQVVEGLQGINEELRTKYAISHVYFVPSDSPSKSVYKLLISELIRRIDGQGEFVVV
jgi:hypothetical protein